MVNRRSAWGVNVGDFSGHAGLAPEPIRQKIRAFPTTRASCFSVSGAMTGNKGMDVFVASYLREVTALQPQAYLLLKMASILCTNPRFSLAGKPEGSSLQEGSRTGPKAA
jgi:hypothetical protein